MVTASALGAQPLPTLLMNGDATAAGSASVCLRPATAALSDVAGAAVYKGRGAASLCYGRWQPSFAGDNFFAGTAFCRFGKVGLALSGRILAGPSSIPVNNNGVTSQTGPAMSASEKDFSLGASYAIWKGLSAGVTARLGHSALGEDYKAAAFGADVSIRYTGQNFHAGIAARNLGTSLKYGEGEKTYAQPALISADGAYSIVGITAGASVQYLFGGAFMASAGLEYGFKDIVFVRAGYHYGPADKAVPSYASAGLGVKFFGFSLDAAYIFVSKTLSGSMFFSLGYWF